jgi:hypothetical protein
MLAQYLNLTDQFNSLPQEAAGITLDVSNYDYVLVQVENPATAISFWATLDDFEITGVSDGNAATAGTFFTSANFVVVLGTTNQGVQANDLSADGIIKFDVVGRYIFIGTLAIGPAPYLDKLLVMLAKIS